MPCSIVNSAAWVALQRHYAQTHKVQMRDLLVQDEDRFAKFSAQVDDIFFDYSKHRVTQQTLELLIALAREADLERWREQLMKGAVINQSENRAALHPILRGSGKVSAEITQAVDAMQAKAFTFAQQVRAGQVTGATGKRLCHIVSIGIGGSYLGNKMLCRALAAFGTTELDIHFVDVGDVDQIQSLLASLPAEQTLFIEISKSLATPETKLSTQYVRSWLNDYYHDDSSWRKHFAVVSANKDELAAYDIPADRRFATLDNIGGRYSIWSTVSLPALIFIGKDNFKQFLAGAHQIDEHFFNQPLTDNIPVTLGLIYLWYASFYRCSSRAVLVYDNALEYLPAYLQQLEMESNGKSVNREAADCDYATAPVVWGGLGLQGQHTFFQLLHQGKHLIPTDFIIAANTSSHEQDYDQLLASNFFAQTHALMAGEQDVEPQQCNAGNQPSTAILLKEISPQTIGALIALYEHQIFVQAMVWQINPYDQWGVEPSKKISAKLSPQLQNQTEPLFNNTTGKLIQQYLQWKRK